MATFLAAPISGVKNLKVPSARRCVVALALVLISVGLGAGVPYRAQAQEQQGAAVDRQSQPVSVKLVVESQTVQSGAVINPAVHFTIPNNWHIYGPNPGKIGLPTKVTYTVPPGFSIGEVSWPPHKSFEQPGGFTGYGYDKEITLSAPVQIPDKLPPGEKFEIQAEVRWLSCYDRCIPGHAKLSKEFTVVAQ